MTVATRKVRPHEWRLATVENRCGGGGLQAPSKGVAHMRTPGPLAPPGKRLPPEEPPSRCSQHKRRARPPADACGTKTRPRAHLPPTPAGGPGPEASWGGRECTCTLFAAAL